MEQSMSDTDQTAVGRNEEILLCYNDQDSDKADALIQKFIAEEPDNLDAHAWVALSKPFSIESNEHFTFIFDRDIHYAGPDKSSDISGDFLRGLKMQLYKVKDDDQEKELRENRILSEMIVHYADLFLKAGRPVPSIPDFAEALFELERYDDVFKIVDYFTKKSNPHEIGWSGLYLCKSMYSDDKGEIINIALNTYFLSKRYPEACRLIKNRIIEEQERKDKYEYYSWYQLGQTLAWLGYPEETARAWIIAIRKGYSASDISIDRTFDELCNMTANENYKEMQEISLRLYYAKDSVPLDKKEIYHELKMQVNSCNGERLELSYIESKLGIKLPKPKTRSRFGDSDRMFVSYEKSDDPVVNEMIAFIDKNTGISLQNHDKNSDQGSAKREKVTVGGPLTVRAGATLEQFGVDLTLQATQGAMAPVIGRDREIERMMRILSRAEKNNPILLGEAGVGKTAIVQGLAQRIVKGDVPRTLKGRKIIELNVGVLVAGTTYRGDFEKRMNDIVQETSDNPDIILFIDELHTLMGAGASSGHGLDGSNMLKPALAAGKLRLIGATTAGEFSRSIEKDPAMERRFSPVWLTEIDKAMTRAVLDARKSLWEKHHGVIINDDVFDTAIQLTDQHVRHRHFPDKAIDAIDEACAFARTLSYGDEQEKRVSHEHIARVIDTWSGAGNSQLSAADKSLLSGIRMQLKKRIAGHEHIIDRLTEIAADEKLGLRLSRLPRVLCFAGHSQCGKTETAAALAQALWPDEKEKFLFVNMPLLSGEHDLNRLTGVQQHYAGSDNTGILPLHLKQHPHSIVFLYQFPKAHPQVMRFFGDLFEEGSFPDPDGRTIYAGSTIFILSTTCDDVKTTFGFGPGASKNSSNNEDIVEILKQLSTPESVVNSLNDTFWFDSLSESQVRDIIEKRLHKAINQPGMKELNICIDPTLSGSLLQEFFDTPSASRNLRTLLNRRGYSAITEMLKMR
jgi:ATP-dependent Clp protease ATP-binding subunit ClpC